MITRAERSEGRERKTETNPDKTKSALDLKKREMEEIKNEKRIVNNLAGIASKIVEKDPKQNKAKLSLPNRSVPKKKSSEKIGRLLLDKSTYVGAFKNKTP
ncbi:hypothetical protein LEP1GSC202_0451 [Leptospira yanagawae serovar Saopaulo str. Sao Paulo = ATCC 700523]|uniref:Uncharacterized protein n=1 Tax=Leptospira yanagawae serovar Saopaulo str. Sao Paulo = ATCC 700523 TaxID=1249483 RepID=A0A5E8HK22_9LEPT|nr:hypothetical protein LEP1GSC202_0451 [Leptospira yanagawae serovar Saopaulo str. Sao Paulo = ATCC 700523]